VKKTTKAKTRRSQAVESADYLAFWQRLLKFLDPNISNLGSREVQEYECVQCRETFEPGVRDSGTT